MKALARRRFVTGIAYLFLIVVSLIFIFPLLWIIISSFKTGADLASSPTSFIPETFTLENYVHALWDLGFVVNLKNSLIVSTVTTIITVIVSCLGAYGIVRFFPKVGRRITKVLITTYMFPPVLLAVPYSMVLAKIGLVNTFTGLVLVYLSFSIPYALWMLVGFYQTVPREIEEAAAVDGAGRFHIFIRISTPIVLPGIVATTIYTFINAFNEFLYALLFMGSSEKMPVAVGLYSLTGTEVLDWGALMAASTCVVVPSVVVFMFIQKYIAAGLSEGSVK
ncbi:carbohydrate ABC transporter permease [Arcanobacterium buesumense]|uniref:Carbohydrate ABC transporter permease n=1 Tax=Arcanobacterium buesumense TaxID=2722751 RepID=A0A6H2EJ34_9ACTO|nr:carbohydrate ABC transporter permease [Arcanobacterium buesumense]QJC21336.1 carbohydrate ABC transporter permease [Arcanobacterium buesumense]